MYGTEDPCMKKANLEEAVFEKHTFVCTQRILQLPIFASFTRVVSNAYTTIKQSHATVTTILVATEQGLEKGVELVNPITEKIESTLEVPLKSVDNTLCLGLDILENKMPSITLPSWEIFDNINNYFRDTVTSITGWYTATLISIVNMSKQLSTKSEQNEMPLNPETKKNS